MRSGHTKSWELHEKSLGSPETIAQVVPAHWVEPALQCACVASAQALAPPPGLFFVLCLSVRDLPHAGLADAQAH